jgi:hypothetical protein
MWSSGNLWASETPPTVSAASAVQKRIVEPLADKENHQSRFSRVLMPPQVRRVRILDWVPTADAQGARFLTFAIDARFGLRAKETDSEEGWRKDAITGCVYPDTGEVFVRRGETYYPAAMLLGKTTKAAPDRVCRSAPAQALNSR